MDHMKDSVPTHVEVKDDNQWPTNLASPLRSWKAAILWPHEKHGLHVRKTKCQQ